MTELKLERTVASYEGMNPDAVASGSHAQILFALRDARKDILTLADALNTRPAAPVEGLERFSLAAWSEEPTHHSYIEPDPLGEYVRYEKAEAIIAALTARVKELEGEVFHDQALGITWKQICEQFDKECQHHQRRAEISEDRVKELEDYAREATKAITGLSGGGSENFSNPIGDLYPADLPFCLERIRERYVSKVELKRLEAQLSAARKAARSAHDTLIEINPSNYNHDDVCQMNDASVEAIFLLADVLGETHGKTAEWWELRRATLEDKP